MIQKHYKKRIVCFLTHILCLINIYSNILEALSFSYNNNILTLNGGYLKSVANRKYEILVSTTYKNIEFTQKVQIKIENQIESPLVLIEYFKQFFVIIFKPFWILFDYYFKDANLNRSARLIWIT
jgi:hypothetical protein